eukprot:8030169-Pyramimonas_sp.AAC.1
MNNGLSSGITVAASMSTTQLSTLSTDAWMTCSVPWRWLMSDHSPLRVSLQASTATPTARS